MSKFKLHVKRDGDYLDITEIVMDRYGDIETIKTDMGIYRIKGNEHIYALYARTSKGRYTELYID